jgi:hypothetical protein
MMLIHAMYIEHIPPNILFEELRQAINGDEEPPLTLAQMHDLWEDRSVSVSRAKRETGTTKDGKPIGSGRKRGNFTNI